MELERDKLGGRIDGWMTGGLFAALFLYIGFQIRPDLIYFTFGTYSNYPTFNPGWGFFHLQLSLAGGLVSYIGNFLSQTFVVSWLGTAVIVLVCGFLYFSTAALFRSPGHIIKRFYGWLPVIGVIMIWQQYDHPMNLALGLALNLGVATAILRFRFARTAVRIPVFSVCVAILYWWTGAMSMVFVSLIVLQELLGDGRWIEGLICGVFGAGVIWILGEWVFCLEPWEVWEIQLPIHPAIFAEMKPWSRIVADAIVAGIVVLFLWDRLLDRWLRWRKPAGVHHRPEKGAYKRSWVGWILGRGSFWIFLISLSAWGLEYSRRWSQIFDSHPLNLEAGLAARNGQWQRVVNAADALKRQGIFHLTTIHDTDRALVHLGQMGDRMFEYPQSIHALLFYTAEGLSESLQYDKISGLMLDLNGLNSAEHFATEVLEIEGNCPFILDRLAVIARAKGQVLAARVFEAALSRQPSHWLEARLLPKVAEARALWLEKSASGPAIHSLGRDHEVRETVPDEMLLELLAADPNNRMAFEYLMAYYLITLQQEKAVGQFYRLKDLGYQRLPRHYAEAAMIALDKTQGKIDLQGWKIGPDVVKQYQMIAQRFREYRSDRRVAMVALAPEFGGSYFYFSMFNQTAVRP